MISLRLWPETLPAGESVPTDVWVGLLAMGLLTMELEADLSKATNGQKVSLVVDVLVFQQGWHVCRTNIRRQVCILQMKIPEGAKKMTVTDGIVKLVGEKTWVCETPGTKSFQQPQLNMHGLLKIVEACSGIGAMGQGFAQCGA